MKKKIFYSMWHGDGTEKVVRQEGFQVKKDGMKFYIYQGSSGRVYVVDPQTGSAIGGASYCSVEDAAAGITAEQAERLREIRETRKYQALKRMFRALKKAEHAKEEYRKLLRD